MEETLLTPQQKEILKYKALIDYYEKHPNAPIVAIKSQYIWVDGTPEVYKAIGAGRKNYSDSVFMYSVELLPSDDPNREWDNFALIFMASRDNVCKKIFKGKKIVPEYVVKGTPSRVIAEHEEDVFEWECSESILSPKES